MASKVTQNAEVEAIHAAFVAEYMKCFDPAKAGVAVGKSRKWGREVYNLPKVRREIESRIKKASTRADVKATDLVAELGAIARYSILDFFCEKDNDKDPEDDEYERWIEMRPLAEIPDEAKAAIKNITTKRWYKRVLPWPEFHDKMDAIQTLGVHLGMFQLALPPVDPRDFLALEQERKRLERGMRALIGTADDTDDTIDVEATVVVPGNGRT